MLSHPRASSGTSAAGTKPARGTPRQLGSFGLVSAALLVSAAAGAQAPAPQPPTGDSSTAAGQQAEGGDGGSPRQDWDRWDDLDTLSPWTPAEPGTEPPLETADAAAGGGRSDWGTADELDTRSPWDASEEQRWGASTDTVSPWDGGVTDGPAEEEARFDPRLGADRPRRPGWAPRVPHGTYDRPHLVRLGTGATAIAIGGYLDVVSAYVDEAAGPDGVRFEPRSLELFFTSRIADRVRAAADIAFEDGAHRVALHTAQVDILFHLGLGLRAGIVRVPIGKFNIAHDAPLYDVIDRPLASTQVIPTVLAEPGVGLFGALGAARGHRLVYDVMAVRGLDRGILTPAGTRLGAGHDPDFADADNDLPAFAGRFAYVSAPAKSFHGELGFSFYAGIYDDPASDPSDDAGHWLRMLALDGELGLGPLTLRGEVVYAHVDLTPAQTGLHASGQLGFYAEAALTFFRRKLGVFERASLAAVVRGDYVDVNLAERRGPAAAVADVTSRLTFGPSFRPAPGTALRLMYYHDWLTDSHGDAAGAGGLQLGLASYF